MTTNSVTFLLDTRELALQRNVARHHSFSHLNLSRLVEHALFKFGATPICRRAAVEPSHPLRVQLGADAVRHLEALRLRTGLSASDLLARCLLELSDHQLWADPSLRHRFRD